MPCFVEAVPAALEGPPENYCYWAVNEARPKMWPSSMAAAAAGFLSVLFEELWVPWNDASAELPVGATWLIALAATVTEAPESVASSAGADVAINGAVESDGRGA